MSDNSSGPEIPVRFDSETHSYAATFASTQINPSVAVVMVMARIRGTAPTKLDPLYNAIDPTALDALLQPSTTDPSAGDRIIEFTYLEYTVRATSYGVIEVEPPNMEPA